jgi:TrmH family RNA methyltransferase
MPSAARDNFAFILAAPKFSGNVGAAARALKNMGFADLRLVAPRGYDPAVAARRAVHAADVVRQIRIFDDLTSALADRTLTIGTTARAGAYRSEARILREAAPDIIAAARDNRIGVVFGPEDYGLSNREVALCHRLVTIPAAPAYPSLNLAQAVAVVAYELGVTLPPPADTATTDRELAAAVEVEAMHRRLQRALIAIGFLSEDNPGHIMHTIRAIHGRGGLRPREVDILNGVARQIEWLASGGAATLAEKRRAGRKLR